MKQWLSISYPGEGNGPTSGNTVYENYVLGIYVPDGGVTQGYVATVPEPTTYAMALAGIACGGYSLFRRREQA